ncbi:hypothetical protein DFJ77DRAFT_443327 [Powellomyces hirtus]|nr:hypothetical protein DFJ77DRAFT_443327 [Powellomyces hirtus]
MPVTVQTARATLAEHLPFIDSASAQVTSSPVSIQFTTLEGLKCVVLVKDDGYLVKNHRPMACCCGTFESLEALLSTISAGYRARFCNALAAKLEDLLPEEQQA